MKSHNFFQNRNYYARSLIRIFNSNHSYWIVFHRDEYCNQLNSFYYYYYYYRYYFTSLPPIIIKQILQRYSPSILDDGISGLWFVQTILNLSVYVLIVTKYKQGVTDGNSIHRRQSWSVLTLPNCKDKSLESSPERQLIIFQRYVLIDTTRGLDRAKRSQNSNVNPVSYSSRRSLRSQLNFPLLYCFGKQCSFEGNTPVQLECCTLTIRG